MLLQKFNLPKETVSYTKIVKNNCLYTSCTKRNKRSDNSFAQLRNGLFVKIYYFFVHAESEKEYVVVKKIETTSIYENVCSMVQIVNEVDNDYSAFLTNEIDQICVHMIFDKKGYLCRVPNRHYY